MKNITTIVVDDDQDVKDVFVELLRYSNIPVIATGSNGKEAFELYKKHRPNIVFMDFKMPEYDGLYGLEKIREYDPDAKVVLVTGSVNIGSELDNCYATAVLPKPIDMNKVMDMINRLSPISIEN
jgi:two-component system chemotaxis response regulator CheY